MLLKQTLQCGHDSDDYIKKKSANHVYCRRPGPCRLLN